MQDAEKSNVTSNKTGWAKRQFSTIWSPLPKKYTLHQETPSDDKASLIESKFEGESKESLSSRQHEYVQKGVTFQSIVTEEKDLGEDQFSFFQ